MYAAFFGLKQEPFSIAPDPRLLFMSERHREALAHLLYGVRGGGGFVLLTGEIGTGKTTVCRSFLEQVPEHCNLAYIFNPKLTVVELLETVCHEFAIDLPEAAGPRTVKDYLDPLNAFLLREHAAGRNNVLVIDEAQNLSADVLEQLRLLTNLETSERKLLQIILIGQPELRELLGRPELEQLAQRVVARYHLKALGEAETADYVRHRLEVSGLQGPLPFDRGALKRIHGLSRGVPRRINLLCDRSLLGAFATGQRTVTRAIVDKASAEVFDDVEQPARHGWAVAAATAVVGVAGVLAVINHGRPEPQAPPVRSSAPTAARAVAVASTPAAPASAPVAMPARVATLLNDESEAWRELAQAWKLAPAGQEPCADMAQQQVQCFAARRSTLALIRQLNRPGILTLDGASGKPSYALLTGLGEQTATLRAAGVEQTVTLHALAQRWQGEYATLWRSPAGYDGPRVPARGPVVDWIAVSLAMAGGAGTPTEPAVLDANLKNRIRAFQVSQGLPADGQPGPMTFMQLNRAAGVDEPRLRPVP